MPPKAVGRKVQAVDINGIYFAGKVIATRQHQGIAQDLIRWDGYGKEHNSWTDSSDVRSPDTYRLGSTHPKRTLLKNLMRGDRVTSNAPGDGESITAFVVHINDPFQCRVSASYTSTTCNLKIKDKLQDCRSDSVGLSFVRPMPFFF